ncbi:thiol reductant ABC exporter subunit CydD [Ketogulonicigenium vulgare]|uniref:ABC transporter, nucleotide binding/ATPase protein n=1 Tax=Ketogulonicigenium vulgare (strain WSH-001) TaxID=759362 RepID=F9Y887_KETVW|nr:thiol reductant ABC exporter subunit CydD [Ketogulonicigenium vulgare]AEM42373.1 ABC transporter, nucleotide binding/ATPase protein [Ketogulonicigenium vulgare WSH-001]ALJ79997.1 ABC transporter ATP-binding protein [Ketogulonicigenium vulgare]ANW32885.1 thiol reductant ABC exporter subunit CydD [Ketogulonicigenium vulgare]AOZ53457.1 cysteine ABC transporter ATP-binding protein/permease [Ketogulonicigenium vulgare]
MRHSRSVHVQRSRNETLPQAGGADLLPSLSSLLWLPQALLIAMAVGAMASGHFDALPYQAMGVLALGALRAWLDALGARLSFQAARAALTDLRAAALARLLASSPLDRDRQESGAAASIIAEQAEAVVPYLARFRPIRCKATILPLVIVAVVFPLSWAAALALLISLPVIPLFMALIGWRAEATSRAQMVELGQMNAFLLERLRGLATIRGLGATARTTAAIHTHAETLREKTMAVLRIAFMTSAVLELFSALGVAMVAVYVGFHLLGDLNFGAWGGQLSLTQGMFILLLAPHFFEPMRELSAVWHDRANGEAALAALQIQIAGAGTQLPSAPPAPASPTAPAVHLDQVSFRHSGADKPVLQALSLKIAAGEHVAIMAPSGGGKSTLLALIAGLVPPDQGAIYIAGQTPAQMRQHMAWIGQDPHIFAGTLAQNISLGRDLPPGAAAQAMADAQMQRVAALHGSGPIGEGGYGLSGGEVLRLSLARAMARPADHPAMLLLADEPTAHLDPTTAAEVTHSLLRAAKGKTLITATHDPVLAAKMDRIIQLDPIGMEDAA